MLQADVLTIRPPAHFRLLHLPKQTPSFVLSIRRYDFLRNCSGGSWDFCWSDGGAQTPHGWNFRFRNGAAQPAWLIT